MENYPVDLIFIKNSFYPAKDALNLLINQNFVDLRYSYHIFLRSIQIYLKFHFKMSRIYSPSLRSNLLGLLWFSQ